VKSDAAQMVPGDRRTVGALLALIAVTVAVYLPALTNGFVGLDDDVYVTANPLIASFSPRSIAVMLTRPYAEFYHPLTLLSLAFDRLVWELNPFGYHLSDLLLHLLNTVLVFVIACRLVRLGRSDRSSATNDFARTAALIGAALFALHPLRVESVAWAAQRKDVLSAFFYLLAFAFYLCHAELESERRSLAWYRASLIAFLLSLLSKSMAVTLPFALVLVDYYPLRRLRSWPRRGMPSDERDAWLEKLPFFGLAVAMVIVTLAAQARGGSIRSAAEIPWLLRPWLVVYSYVFYLWKSVVPTGLTVLYPVPLHVGVHNAASWASLFLLLAITAAAWLLRRRWPAFAAAWLFYLITLAPVSGFLTFGAQSVADRYSYLPLLGLYLLVGLVVARINQIGDEGWRPTVRALGGAAVAVALVALGYRTSLQINSWHEGESLWLHHLAFYPDNARVRFNLGYFYQSHGQADKALHAYQRCLLISPSYFDANMNLGGLLLRRNDLEGAHACFGRAIERRPDHPGAHYNQGLVLVKLAKQDEAIEQFKTAVQLDPDFADAHAALGQALADKGNVGAAIREYNEALKRNPRLAPTHEGLGLAYLAVGQKDLARREFERALSLDSRLPDSLIELSRFDAASSHPLVALGRLSRAARLRPDDPEIHLLKAQVVWQQGALSLAESSLRQAIEIDPDSGEAYFQLGLLLEQKGRVDEALEALFEARIRFQSNHDPVPKGLLEAFDRVDGELRAKEAKR